MDEYPIVMNQDLPAMASDSVWGILLSETTQPVVWTSESDFNLIRAAVLRGQRPSLRDRNSKEDTIRAIFQGKEMKSRSVVVRISNGTDDSGF